MYYLKRLVELTKVLVKEIVVAMYHRIIQVWAKLNILIDNIVKKVQLNRLVSKDMIFWKNVMQPIWWKIDIGKFLQFWSQ